MTKYASLEEVERDLADFDYETSSSRPIRFPLERACDFEPPTGDDWLIKGLIPREGVGTLFGESGHYKSFTALHIALHIATGKPWGGRKVKHPGPVVYIAVEGARGSKKRIQGIIRAHNAGDLPIYQISKPLNFGTSNEHAEALIKDIEAQGVELAAKSVTRGRPTSHYAESEDSARAGRARRRSRERAGRQGPRVGDQDRRVVGKGQSFRGRDEAAQGRARRRRGERGCQRRTRRWSPDGGTLGRSTRHAGCTLYASPQGRRSRGDTAEGSVSRQRRKRHRSPAGQKAQERLRCSTLQQTHTRAELRELLRQ